MTGLRRVLNIGVPRTGTVYVQRTLSPVWPHGHYQFTRADWTHAGFTNLCCGDLDADTFVVGFVRNPFDLIVSHYALLQRMDVLVAHHDRRLATLPFRDYVELVAHRRNLYPQRFPLHFPLFDDDWKLVPHYLGRAETLDTDLHAIADLTGATYTPMSPVNTAPRGDWRGYYDDTLYRLVEDAWHADLTYFGYSRDGITGAAKTTFGLDPQPVAP